MNNISFSQKMKLKELYEEVLRSKEWIYFKDSDLSFSLEKLDCPVYCRDFIKQMINVGGKEDNHLVKAIEKLSSNRLQHIVSCFFCGFIFYLKFPCIRDSIKKLLNNLPFPEKEKDKERFAYIWFLICLFHDLGYAIENDNIEIPSGSIQKLPNRPSYIPEIYSKRNIVQYEKYRKCRWGCRDHGVSGGKIFFSEMYKLREKKEKEYSNRYWGKEMVKIYACAAWTIVCHNIFYIQRNDENECCYRHYKLDNFIFDSICRNITLEKSPLLFLFCLVDTIEPIKTLNNINLLNSIEVMVEESEVQFDLHNLSTKKKEYSTRIKSLNDWLTKVELVKSSSSLVEDTLSITLANFRMNISEACGKFNG